MARIQIVIEDSLNHNVNVEIHSDVAFPDNALLYTNAMHLTKEVENFLLLLLKQANDSKNQAIQVF